MKLLPNLSKVPIRFSLIVIASSPVAYYLLASHPANANLPDLGAMLRDGINHAYAQTQAPPPPPLPVPEAPPVGRYDEPQGCPPQVAYREPVPAPQRVQPVASRGTRTYWAGNQRVLRDKRAIALLNMAPSTRRSTIANHRVDGEPLGMGTWRGDAYVYETGDGLIQLNFTAANRLNDDQLEWAGFVQ